MTDLIIKDFDGIQNQQQQQSQSSLVESSRANKEVEASVILSKKYPRDEQASVNRILNSCTRPALAGKAIYSFKRAGQKVEGPSIRLAEVIARCWGNLQFGVKEVERGSNYSIVEAFCWDLETNMRSSKEFSVQHVRDTKQGQKQLTNERDIYEAVANQGSRRLRNCILSCIPEDVVERAQSQVNQTLLAAAKGSAIDMQDRIRKMLEAFQELKITRKMIETYLNVKPEAASAKQIVDLGKIYTSIKEGYADIKDFFKVEEASLQDSIVKEDIKISNQNALEELERLKKQALQIGISQETLDRFKPDPAKPSTVDQAISMLKTVISTRMIDKSKKVEDS
jgi:hypothetical protein